MTKKTRTRKRSCASSIAKFLEAKNSLKEILRPGDSISVHLNSVSSSGMTRHLTFLIARIDGNGIPFIWNITRLVAKATGLRYNDKKEDLVVGGCGMDMGFAVVYDLGRDVPRRSPLRGSRLPQQRSCERRQGLHDLKDPQGRRLRLP